MEQRYCLEDDGDGHYYIVPIEKKAAFQKALEQCGEDAYEEFEDFLCENEDIRQTDGPHVLTFTDPRDRS